MADQSPGIVIIMGVSGSGKTTIGEQLAKRTGATFADADDFHSDANKAKMHAGTPLTDADRAPWLATLNQLLRRWADAGTLGILACSALKEGYRQTLGAGLPTGKLAFVWLDGSKEMIAARLSARQNSFMNPALLQSQLDTLEVPAEAVRVVNDRTPDEVVDEILTKLKLTPAAS